VRQYLALAKGSVGNSMWAAASVTRIASLLVTAVKTSVRSVAVSQPTLLVWEMTALLAKGTVGRLPRMAATVTRFARIWATAVKMPVRSAAIANLSTPSFLLALLNLLLQLIPKSKEGAGQSPSVLHILFEKLLVATVCISQKMKIPHN